MDGQMAMGVVFAVGGFVVTILVMLLGRELLTWYWKVNATLEQLVAMQAVLRNIDKNLIVVADLAQERQQGERRAS